MMPAVDWLPVRGRGEVQRQNGGTSRWSRKGGASRSWSMLSRAAAQEGLGATIIHDVKMFSMYKVYILQYRNILCMVIFDHCIYIHTCDTRV